MLVAWSCRSAEKSPETLWPGLSPALGSGRLGVAAAAGRRLTTHSGRGRIAVSLAPPWGPTATAIADAFDRHAFGMARHLRGEFAAVVLDFDSETLFAVAALASREPLAFTQTPDGVLVSTRVLALLRHPSVSRALDEGYLAHVVTGLCYPPPGTTALRAVRR